MNPFESAPVWCFHQQVLKNCLEGDLDYFKQKFLPTFFCACSTQNQSSECGWCFLFHLL